MSRARSTSARRTVVTGIGVVAPTGIGTEAWWDATCKGTSGIRPITRFDASAYPVRLAGELTDFDQEEYVDERLALQTDRWTVMALAAAQMALQDAGFDRTGREPAEMGVVLAGCSGGAEVGQKALQSLWGKGAGFVGAYASTASFHGAAAAQLAIKFKCTGPTAVLASEGAGGLDALQYARRLVRRGADALLTGGASAPLVPLAFIAQLSSGLLSRERRPAAAYRPFDARANGYVPGEGGAILVVEELAAAHRRVARQIYGEIVGYGATQDASHYSSPAPDGRQLARAMTLALDRAGVEPDEVDVVFADAAGIPAADLAEAEAIRQTFCERSPEVPITAPKSMVGRLYSGGATLDLAAALLAMRDGCIPPTVNLDRPAQGCELNFVTGKAGEAKVDTALINARGFGGFNSSMVVRRLPDHI